jgi:hypothetical protein
MGYSRQPPGPAGHNRAAAGYYSQPAGALLARLPHRPRHPRNPGRTEDRSRRGATLGSQDRNRAYDIPRHSGCKGDGLGQRTASVLIAPVERLDGVRTGPGITISKVEQSYGETLRTMERSGPCHPCGLSQQIRHAGRASSPEGQDSLSGNRARLEENRKPDAACLNSRPTGRTVSCVTFRTYLN